MNTLFLQSLLVSFFLSVVFLHAAKRNFWTIILYGLQSLIIAILLVLSFLETGAITALFMAGIILVVKVILTPLFFIKLIKKYNLKFLVSTYINIPLTFIIITILTVIAHSSVFLPLTTITPSNHLFLSIILATLFIYLFLIINRKGVLSQITGVLSLENSMVAFALFSGLEQSLALQIGIIFDIFVWIIITTIFMSMLYKHFKSFDVTKMEELKD